jgi:ParB/RepB/Spo0J family partition protein
VERVDQTQINVLPLDSLVVPETPIRVNAEIGVGGLAESVGRDGLLEPLVVRPSKREAGKYEVVCGLRRFLAAQKVGLKAVPCVVKEMSDVEAMEAMLIENMERENLTDYELGRWFKLLMEKFPDKYPSQEAVADRFGFETASQVSRLISHYEFMEELATMLPANILPRGKMLPERVVREIRRADPEYWAVLVKAYFKSVDEGMPLGVAGMAALVDSFCRRLPSVTRQPKEEKPRKPEEEEKPQKSAAVTAPPVPSSVEAETEEVEPEITGKLEPEKVEKVLEEERQRITAEMGIRKKLDRAGRIYLTLINYYPEELVVFLEKYCDLSIMSETQIVELARGIIGLILEEVTDYGKNMRPLEKALETYKKWR